MGLDKKIYFASDFHLGVPDRESSLIREKKIVQWLDDISKDAAEIFLVGDVFDFWYEYKNAIPKGFVRIQGKIAELCDQGIKVHYFTGNHDMWAFNYFTEELGVIMYRDNAEFEFNGKKFLVGHGDGLGPGDHGYKFIKKVFANPVLQWLFGWIHPNIGIGIANFWSGRSRMSNMGEDQKFLGEENEWLATYCRDMLKSKYYDYFIFGHRHLPLDLKVGETSRYINLGEWVNYTSYAVFDGKKLELKEY
ncbi:MAG: UDP-2,3-diacylglucosamine hydrolase [Crocinitomicaceae bacterium]|nr:UDP-2,3-diacylglucosamine hydrolase [Crocinitomicaceae bacterium]